MKSPIIIRNPLQLETCHDWVRDEELNAIGNPNGVTNEEINAPKKSTMTRNLLWMIQKWSA